MTNSVVQSGNLKLCQCGKCNEMISIKDNRGRNRYYKKGHNCKGNNNPAYKGGRIIDKEGYIQIKKLTHPFCNSDGYVREHRLVMEQHLNRYLTKDEVVHHKDKDKQNNKIENLQLFSNNSEHISYENINYRWNKNS